MYEAPDLNFYYLPCSMLACFTRVACTFVALFIGVNGFWAAYDSLWFIDDRIYLSLAYWSSICA